MSKIKKIDGENSTREIEPPKGVERSEGVEKTDSAAVVEPGSPVRVEAVEGKASIGLSVQALNEVVKVVCSQMASGSLTYEHAVERIVAHFIQDRFQGGAITEQTRLRMRAAITEYLQDDPLFATLLKNTEM